MHDRFDYGRTCGQLDERPVCILKAAYEYRVLRQPEIGKCSRIEIRLETHEYLLHCKLWVWQRPVAALLGAVALVGITALVVWWATRPDNAVADESTLVTAQMQDVHIKLPDSTPLVLIGEATGGIVG